MQSSIKVRFNCKEKRITFNSTPEELLPGVCTVVKEFIYLMLCVVGVDFLYRCFRCKRDVALNWGRRRLSVSMHTISGGLVFGLDKTRTTAMKATRIVDGDSSSVLIKIRNVNVDKNLETAGAVQGTIYKRRTRQVRPSFVWGGWCRRPFVGAYWEMPWCAKRINNCLVTSGYSSTDLQTWYYYYYFPLQGCTSNSSPTRHATDC